MHYCVGVITEQFPTDNVLMEKLAPYNEEKFYEGTGEDEEITKEYPQFMWDFWTVGGRYGGKIKLKIDLEDEEYRWQFYDKEPRSGRLFRHKMLEDMNANPPRMFFSEEDYYKYLGEGYEHLRVDGCKIKDAIGFDELVVNCWGFIGRNGEAYSRDHWNGKDFVSDDQYEDKVKAAIKGCDDCYITFVDIHD